MKRVLVITYYWPPSGGSGVQRWLKFAKYLPAEGWQPVIYTPENPELLVTDTTLESEISPDIQVLKTKILEPYRVYKRLLGRKSGADGGSDEVNPVNARQKTLLQRLAMYVRGNIFVPDPRCFWIRPSVKFLKQHLKQNSVDVIVSTGPPHSMHLIAQKVSKATGVPWVADFRDPWTKVFYFKHLSLSNISRRKHERLEKSVLDDASAAIAVSPSVCEEFQNMSETPICLITNGYDEDDFGDTLTETIEDSFRITHTGLFAADGNPDEFWKVLREKCDEDEAFSQKLEIRLAGKTDREIITAIEQAGLKENLKDLGYCSHLTAVGEQRATDILLLPLRKEPEYKSALPGKLFEYLAARRFVLGIGQPDGDMARILQETGAGVVADWADKATMRKLLDERWEAFKAGESGVTSVGIEKYSRRNLTKRLADLLNKVSATVNIGIE